MQFQNLIKRFIRHPITRGSIGLAICCLSFAGTFFCLAIARDALSASANAMLNTGSSYFIALEIACFLIGGPIFAWYRNREAQRQTAKFDSSGTGRKISNIIKKVCKRNGLAVPYRALKDDFDVNAESQSFPNPRRICITKGLFDQFKYKEISDKHIESTIAHELAHIYHHHNIFAIPQAAYAFANFLLYGGRFFSVITAICLIVSLATTATFPMIGLAILGMIQLCNFGLWASKAIGNIGGRILERALETQADLTGCKFSSVQNMLKDYERPTKVKKAPKTYLEWCDQSLTAITKYYDSWYRSHPTHRERAEDIKLFNSAYRNR